MVTKYDKDTPFDVEIKKGSFDPDQYRQPKNIDSHQQTTYGQQLNLGSKKENKQQKQKDERQQTLEERLKIEESLAERATQAVVWSSPLITQQDVSIIGRATINIVQGAFGSHKSRLAELLAALMLTTNDSNDLQFLGFKRITLERFCVCYIDTERNLTEEFPYAIQSIKIKAGFKREDKPADFRFTSIKDVERARRFDAIEDFIRQVREQTELHLFVLIDVVTDAIGDFNDPKESMRLFDFLGNLCDRHNASFLLVIHQNPGTDKARGHTGTEAANKASTVIQIGFEKIDKDEESELIKLRYLKLRRGKRPEPIFLQYNDKIKGLQLASTEAVTAYNNSRKHKAPVEAMAEQLERLLSEKPMTKGNLVTELMKHFSASNKTIRNRLDETVEQSPDMYDNEGRLVRLLGYREGKQEFYKLEPLA